MPAVLNAANEAAVEFFLDGKIGFNDIPAIIKKTMDAQEAEKADRMETVLAAHCRAYEHARGLIGSVKVK